MSVATQEQDAVVTATKDDLELSGETWGKVLHLAAYGNE
jgi:hypothetical protein